MSVQGYVDQHVEWMQTHATPWQPKYSLFVVRAGKRIGYG